MIGYEHPPRQNPRYSHMLDKFDWMYYPEGYWDKTEEFQKNYPTFLDQDLLTHISPTEKIIYKYHICLELDTYLTKGRKVVSNFLHKNKILHKCVGTKGRSPTENPFTDIISNESDSQYGKTFTVYITSEDEMYRVAKGMQILAKKYNLKGIKPSKFKAISSNMTYERPVPGTNNTLYYAVEMATAEAIYQAIINQAPDMVVKDDTTPDTRFELMVQGPMSKALGQLSSLVNTESKHGPRTLSKVPSAYLSLPRRLFSGFDNREAYSVRRMVMEHYWGQGPIDFLWD